MTIGISKERLEEWAPVVGHENYYEVSTFGRVRKVDGEIISQSNHDQGYKLVRLSNPRTMARVHRLVAIAFVPNPDNYNVVNHIDHCRSSNHYTNLEWCTQKKNLNHAFVNGRMPNDYWKGKRSPSAKLPDSIASSIRNEYSSGCVSWMELSNKYHISKRTIGRILKGQSYV